MEDQSIVATLLLFPTQLSAAQSIYLKNKAKKYFQGAIYRHAYRQQATAYENIGFFRWIGLEKISPSIAEDDDHAILGALAAKVLATHTSYRFAVQFVISFGRLRCDVPPCSRIHPRSYTGCHGSVEALPPTPVAPQPARRGQRVSTLGPWRVLSASSLQIYVELHQAAPAAGSRPRRRLSRP